MVKLASGLSYEDSDVGSGPDAGDGTSAVGAGTVDKAVGENPVADPADENLAAGGTGGVFARMTGDVS